MSEPESDQSLMQRSAGGDAQAFRELVERYGTAVFGLARRQLGSDADAEEIAQEAFMRLYRAASRYQPEVPLRSYLLTIATRLCLNRRSRQERRRIDLRSTQDLDASSAKEGESQLEAIERRELEQRVRQALDLLPADQRLAVVLMRFEGLGCAEIARVMKRSEGAVHALLFRARDALRRCLSGFLGSGSEEV